MYAIQLITKSGDKCFFQYLSSVLEEDFAVFSASDQYDFEDFIQVAIFRDEKSANMVIKEIIYVNEAGGNYIGSTISVIPLAEINA